MATRIAPFLFPLDPAIRYVAVQRAGAIAEMQQSPDRPTFNPPETDRMEELIVNPIVLEALRRRGNLDLDGVRHVTIRYGKQYQVVLPIEDGHVSVGVELGADVEQIAERIEATLSGVAVGPLERALKLALTKGLH
jgi:hypothetical protein